MSLDQDMAATAGAIAGGDLSRRVETTDDRTEVGQLGNALNVMLTGIEGAFAARAASEERLRRFLADAFADELPPRVDLDPGAIRSSSSAAPVTGPRTWPASMRHIHGRLRSQPA